MAERRRHYRLNLQLPLDITTPDKNEHLSRISKNISAGGIYFAGPPNKAFVPGQKLNIKIAIPRTDIAENNNILNMNATVIRSEPIGNSVNIPRMGIACKFDKPLTVISD